MTRDPNTPEPLVSSAEDGELRALLEAGRDELPTKAQLDGLAAKLGPILGPGGPGGGHGGGGAVAAAKTAAGGTIAKLLGAVTLTVVVAGGAVHSLRDRAASEATATMQSTSAVIAAAPTPIVAPRDEAPVPAPSAPPVVAVAPRLPRPATHPTATAATPEDPDAEAALLGSAHGALSSDPARTLALCAEHARRFPDGLMVQEREVLAIEALVKTGRMDDARARADRFAATYPSSTHLRRIHAVLGDTP